MNFSLIFVHHHHHRLVGMLLAGGKGVARTAYCDQKSYGDFMPCDIAINGVFVCTWNFFNH
jgi:hypothetical protein